MELNLKCRQQNTLDFSESYGRIFQNAQSGYSVFGGNNIPLEMKIQRRSAWNALFNKYGHDKSQGDSCKLSKIKGLEKIHFQMEDRIPLRKSTDIIQYWVDTGYFPYLNSRQQNGTQGIRDQKNGQNISKSIESAQSFSLPGFIRTKSKHNTTKIRTRFVVESESHSSEERKNIKQLTNSPFVPTVDEKKKKRISEDSTSQDTGIYIRSNSQVTPKQDREKITENLNKTKTVTDYNLVFGKPSNLKNKNPPNNDKNGYKAKFHKHSKISHINIDNCATKNSHEIEENVQSSRNKSADQKETTPSSESIFCSRYASLEIKSQDPLFEWSKNVKRKRLFVESTNPAEFSPTSEYNNEFISQKTMASFPSSHGAMPKRTKLFKKKFKVPAHNRNEEKNSPKSSMYKNSTDDSFEMVRSGPSFTIDLDSLENFKNVDKSDIEKNNVNSTDIQQKVNTIKCSEKKENTFQRFKTSLLRKTFFKNSKFRYTNRISEYNSKVSKENSSEECKNSDKTHLNIQHSPIECTDVIQDKILGLHKVDRIKNINSNSGLSKLSEELKMSSQSETENKNRAIQSVNKKNQVTTHLMDAHCKENSHHPISLVGKPTSLEKYEELEKTSSQIHSKSNGCMNGIDTKISQSKKVNSTDKINLTSKQKSSEKMESKSKLSNISVNRTISRVNRKRRTILVVFSSSDESDKDSCKSNKRKKFLNGTRKYSDNEFISLHSTKRKIKSKVNNKKLLTNKSESPDKIKLKMKSEAVENSEQLNKSSLARTLIKNVSNDTSDSSINIREQTLLNDKPNKLAIDKSARVTPNTSYSETEDSDST